jgi:nondiscriminating glutamyl-tRNA synthetase
MRADCSTTTQTTAVTPRVRIAPSPTGPLHIGTARTALFNFLFARHTGGTFILRLEDTDVARSTVEHERDILDGLHWLGLDWDEGPEVAGQPARGPYGPYRQMERLDLYRAAADRLLAEDKAYECYCSPEQLAADRAAQEASHEPVHYVGRCAHLTAAERSARNALGLKPVIRFRVGEGIVEFDDIVRGHVTIDTNTLGGDLVIVRSNGDPLYHFTVVVDDAQMEITHVIRGEDHLSNTPKHILLFRALGAPEPKFAHLPLILNPDRTKMSKRKSQTALDAYRAEGFLPEAIVNFLAFLGWSVGTEEEIFTLEELAQRFDLERVQSGGAVFDRVRLEWLNGQWIRRLADDDLADRLMPFLVADLETRAAKGADVRAPTPDDVRDLLPMVRERLPTLSAIGALIDYLFVDPIDLDRALLVPKRWDAAATLVALTEARRVIRRGR